jgi:four helix bundle protein
MITRLEDFKVYNRAMNLGEEIFKIVSTWDSFGKDTIGKQLVRAVDSIAANLSEGLGRYHYKEVKNFSFYARGSLFETKTWLAKVHGRRLITDIRFSRLGEEIEEIGKMINGYIKSIGHVSEPEEEYGTYELPDA